jgi:hypothetical protein
MKVYALSEEELARVSALVKKELGKKRKVRAAGRTKKA